MNGRSFDLRFWLILAGLGGLLAVIALAGDLAGLAAPQLLPANGEIGMAGPVTLLFPEPMSPESVETRLNFDPPQSGRYVWNSQDGRPERMVSFWPDKPFQPGQTYVVRLAAGALGQSGLTLRRAFAWQVKIRPAEVLYLSPSASPELWRAAPGSGLLVQLTHTGGAVFDYGISPGGQEIIFSAYNEQSGVDLWQISREGGEPQLLLPCQSDWCVNPAYAPDGRTVAYSRRKSGAAPGEGPGVPRIWLIDLSTRATDILFPNPGVGGFDPDWSPDGRYLAFFDALSGGIRVLDIAAKTDFLLPSQMGANGAWSPDSRYLVFTDTIVAASGPYVAVYIVDVQTQEVRRILSDDLDQVDYSSPVWTADGAGLVAALRLMTGSPTRQIWLISLDLESGLEREKRLAITSDQLFTHASYHWDLAGENLVYQRLEIGVSSPVPQVGVWNRASQEASILAEDAFQPRWIP